MYLVILLSPLFSALCSGFGGRFLGAQGASILSTSLVGFTFIICFLCFLEIGLGGEVVVFKLGNWIDSGSMEVSWGFLFDPLSISVLCVVTGISSLVHLYSTSYISADPHRPRFIA